MVFSDLFFLFVFIPLFVLCYLVGACLDKRAGKYTFRNLVLIVFSLVFYAWGEPSYVFLMLFSVMINYLVGLRIGKSEGRRRKGALALGVGANLAILFVFKYAGFVIGDGVTDFKNLEYIGEQSGIDCQKGLKGYYWFYFNAPDNFVLSSTQMFYTPVEEVPYQVGDVLSFSDESNCFINCLL